ncbi:formylglycine-generating enzyme family protein [Niveispirillum fermenti]|uniref:formylglycine-generating enzyme family protein n=2 Tax=Niveispirillum fermenti TaxID=1233113 RepID=UPI003A894E84
MSDTKRPDARQNRFTGMAHITGGTFTMGSDRFYPEEKPRRRVRVGSFWIDTTPVTNAQFDAFVTATGYRTFAELPPDPRLYPGMDPSLAVAGSAVFQKTAGPVPLDNHGRWWAFVPGADWRHPTGPDSGIAGLEDHPVVQIAHADAAAYAKWAGKALPTEAEWEFAARGGLEDKEYAWGDELAPDGAILANYWQGTFPHQTLKEDGNFRTTPVGRFPANGHGLYDMVGNVWEWTHDWFGTNPRKPAKACCAVDNPRGATLRESMDPYDGTRMGRKVIKGGSHLCAPNYCQRYRPAARHPQSIDSPTSHIGFRCIVRG